MFSLSASGFPRRRLSNYRIKAQTTHAGVRRCLARPEAAEEHLSVVAECLSMQREGETRILLPLPVPRLPAPDRNGLPPEDQAVWDRIAAVRGGVRGPFGVLMHVPQLADRVRALEDYFRFDGDLPAADRELVILVTAREMEAPYAWARHEHRAHEEGTSTEAVAAVRANGSLEGLTKRDRLLVEITRALLRTRRLTDTQYAEAVTELGEPQLIELVALAGHYSLIGLTLGAFEVPQPDDLPTNYTF